MDVGFKIRENQELNNCQLQADWRIIKVDKFVIMIERCNATLLIAH